MQVNGFDAIALTRLDILSAFDPIQVCVAYELDRARIDYFPSIPTTLERCQPVYEELPGWLTPLEPCTRYEELPVAARAYVEWLEELLGAPIDSIGVGAERAQTISRRPLI